MIWMAPVRHVLTGILDANDWDPPQRLLGCHGHQMERHARCKREEQRVGQWAYSHMA